MTARKTGKRGRLTSAAAELSYRQGFGDTTLADIARVAEVPLGNLYYYFKSRTEIGEAIADQRMDQCRMKLQVWTEAGGPKDRLKALVRTTVEHRNDLAQSGCPIGSFCSELQKLDKAVARRAAAPFRALLPWIEEQFSSLGRRDQSLALAVHLLSALQGVSLLANALESPDLVTVEAANLEAWIDGL